MNSNIVKTALTGCMIMLLASCGKNDPNSPGIEYMPDMYRSPSFETNMSVVIDGDTVAANRLPAAHTIAQGKMPYMYSNDIAGYDSAGKFLKNPIPFSEKMLEEGKVLFEKYCMNCHGEQGKGDGLVGSKLPGPPPSYSGPLKDLPEGKIFHSISVGKGLMGAHSNILTPEERWKLVHYVQKLQGPKSTGENITASATDSIPAVVPVAEEKKSTKEKVK